MPCTEACKEKTAARQAEIEAWRACWPNACPNCRGAGGKSYPGSFDHRAGVGEPPSFEPCDCVLDGRCPRCGADPAFDEYEHKPCGECGWFEGDDQEPEPYECGCWYGEMMAEEDARSLDEQPP